MTPKKTSEVPKTFALCSTSACLCLCLWVSIPHWLFSLYFSSVGFWTPRIGNKKDKALSPVQWGSCNRKSTKVHNCEIFLLQGQESLAAQPDNVLVRTLSHLKQTPLGPYGLIYCHACTYTLVQTHTPKLSSTIFRSENDDWDVLQQEEEIKRNTSYDNGISNIF